MTGPHDEVANLLEVLIFTVRLIAANDVQDKQRIAAAYGDARSLVSAIGLDDEGAARPRIVACFERFNACKAANDVAAAGWMLTAIQERVAERDLPGWKQLRTIVKNAARELPQTEKPTWH